MTGDTKSRREQVFIWFAMHPHTWDCSQKMKVSLLKQAGLVSEKTYYRDVLLEPIVEAAREFSRKPYNEYLEPIDDLIY